MRHSIRRRPELPIDVTVPSSSPAVGAPVVIEPAEAALLVPALRDAQHPEVWVYRYEHPDTGWRLSIATHASPGSGKLSLGGFRIAPESRTSAPGFDSDREAIGLAIGMEEKVYWSRVMHVGGPLALRDTARIVGGKCVLHPTPDARVGQPNDRALLDFALACFTDLEARAGFHLTTGQDMGHGLMFDGIAQSLEYLNDRFLGSVVADTSKPTGEGNFRVLAGMLAGFDIPVASATVGLIGCGHVGMHLLGQLREAGATVLALEASPARRAELETLGVRTFTPDQKDAFLAEPMDAIAVNAAGGSLDPHTIDRIISNQSIRVICGSENLVMPDERAGAELLRAAGRAYAPTELGGMMGYLTAVEEYLSQRAGRSLDVESMCTAAAPMEALSERAVRLARASAFAIGFPQAMERVSAS